MKERKTAFLADIARYYTAEREGVPPLASLCFVLPNKRSAMFLKQHVRSCLTEVSVMPRFMTMRTFLSMHARYPEAPQGELMFILYEAYRSTLHARGRTESAREFDSFIFWGDIILSDFDDIDRSMANAADLFKNLRNVKEIQANYLDDDQKEVVRRIWGDSMLTNSAEEFWLHLADPDTSADETLSGKFVYLWEILGEVYTRFHASLEERKMSSAGAQYRQAVEYFKKMTVADINPDEHFVFAGFNDLSTAETIIFKRLKDIGAASFFWDTAPLSLSAENRHTAIARPLRRIKELNRIFPMPDDFVPEPLPSRPEIEVLAMPSNAGQAKALGRTLQKWSDDGILEPDSPMSGAVVMPDPSLLMPVLFSIPEAISSVNISLGLPYRSTNFASLLRSIVSMQLRARMIRGVPHFYFEDVVGILLHPHIQLIVPEAAQRLTEYISAEKIYNLPAETIAAAAPELTAIFTPVKGLSDAGAVAKYLTDMLDWLGAKIEENDDRRGRRFESMAIKYFREETVATAALIEKYGVTMSERTFLHLFERLFGSRALTVNGTPLRGLQVLGVLETRALDFDNVAILSMNEGIFPRKQYSKTMIPAVLRGAFGLPDFDSLEETYAFCFYRLLARARRITLYYDSRSEALGGGEISRYISQIRYLMPDLEVSMKSLSPGAVPEEAGSISVPKTERVLARLAQLRSGGAYRFSATALKAYRRCPLQFYLQYVGRMRGSDELADFISAADYGDIVHKSIQELFAVRKGAYIDKSFIDDLLDDSKQTIARTVRKVVTTQCYPQYVTDDMSAPLPPEGELCCEIVGSIVRSDLRAETEAYCNPGFTFIENEKQYDSPAWTIDNDLAINFYMSIDRVDRISGEALRFIDFKTGNEATTASIDELFDGDSTDTDGIFQLLVYCEAYAAMIDPRPDITPMIHPMKELSKEARLSPIEIDGVTVDSYKQVSDVFLPRLKAMIKEIFDPDVPFRQCDEPSRCAFCPFLSLCGRVVPKY